MRSCTDAAVREILELPESIRPDLLVAVGHPAGGRDRAPKAPRPLVYAERFGDPWEEAP
jgi:hypothetical protein